MPHYLRPWVPGGTFFLTVVTLNRRRIFNSTVGRRILGKAVNQVKREFPFSLDAWVLLPDHFHAIWTLPEGDTNYSKRVGLIKAHFSKAARKWLHDESLMNPSWKIVGAAGEAPLQCLYFCIDALWRLRVS